MVVACVFPRLRGKYGRAGMGAGDRRSVASKDESPCDSPPPSRFAIHLPRFAREEEVIAALQRLPGRRPALQNRLIRRICTPVLGADSSNLKHLRAQTIDLALSQSYSFPSRRMMPASTLQEGS